MRLLLTNLILLHASAEDIKSGKISNWCFVLVMLLATSLHIKAALIIALIYIAVVFLISIFNLPLPIGMGDAKIILGLAFSFGGSVVIKTLLISELLAGTYAFAYLIARKIKRKEVKSTLPFLPFITIAFIFQSLFFL